MKTKEKQPKRTALNKALKSVKENKPQDLAKENIGNEPEERQKGDPDSPYKLKAWTTNVRKVLILKKAGQ